jgi:F-box and WD-40 domain protein 1/11
MLQGYASHLYLDYNTNSSADRTVRTYTFPDLLPQFILGAHRAAVNAVSISDSFIVSGSGG